MDVSPARLTSYSPAGPIRGSPSEWVPKPLADVGGTVTGRIRQIRNSVRSSSCNEIDIALSVTLNSEKVLRV